MWKNINFCFFLIFCFAIAVQYNDPDPYLWMPIYAVPAVACFYFFRGRPIALRWVRVGALVGFLGGIAWFLFHLGDITSGNLEPLWETFGLLLTASVLAMQIFITRAQKGSSMQAQQV